MNEKELKKYIRKTFYFDVEKEKSIYKYLCKQKMKKRAKKLDKQVMFNSYSSWKMYIMNKYQFYDKCCLIEFRRMLELMKRNSDTYGDFNKELCIAQISSIISLTASFIVAITTENQEVRMILLLCVLFASILIVPCAIAFFIDRIFRSYKLEEMNKYFWEDVIEILDELIKNKKE